jgi:formate hydrogenlyase subunit 3/multisubunit Na+/H+ antiporter MnhD subunit
MVARMAAKSLLFSTCTAIGTAADSDDLEKLSGIGAAGPVERRGSGGRVLTLAGLPPMAGFVSEWPDLAER